MPIEAAEFKVLRPQAGAGCDDHAAGADVLAGAPDIPGRSAIHRNHDLLATSLAEFLNDHGIRPVGNGCAGEDACGCSSGQSAADSAGGNASA